MMLTATDNAFEFFINIDLFHTNLPTYLLTSTVLEFSLSLPSALCQRIPQLPVSAASSTASPVNRPRLASSFRNHVCCLGHMPTSMRLDAMARDHTRREPRYGIIRFWGWRVILVVVEDVGEGPVVVVVVVSIRRPRQ